jgi:catechol-2,3-dioxygenase
MSPIRPTQVAHVFYRTLRFEQMLRWYETVFRATVISKGPALAFLTFDGQHHRFGMLNLAAVRPEGAAPPPAQPRGLVGVDHVAYTYESLGDLLVNFAELKEAGIEPYWCIHHGLTVSMYYADPDGNQMEFQVDAFNTAEELQAYITGPLFGVNPIGVEFDPTEMLARFRAGTPVAELIRRETAEPVSPIRGEMAALAAA